jgi:hypothetical protein
MPGLLWSQALPLAIINIGQPLINDDRKIEMARGRLSSTDRPG